MLYAGSLAAFQPCLLNQPDFLDTSRAMPWQQQQPQQQQQLQAGCLTAEEAVWIVAGDAAGRVNVWAGVGTGQHTWQHHACHDQVSVLLTT